MTIQHAFILSYLLTHADYNICAEPPNHMYTPTPETMQDPSRFRGYDFKSRKNQPICD